MIFKNKKDKKEERINKSIKTIKEEKKNLKKEKRKLRKLKIKSFFLDKNYEKQSLKEQILSMIYFEIIGFILCILVFFILCNGKNYIRLYSELNKLINVYDTITTNYYGDLDKKEMIDNAIEAMLSEAGDNYTTYTNKKETTEFLENVDGTYEGIGCTVTTNKEKQIYVVNVFKDGPAEKAGLKENDIIMKIDGISYEGKTSSDMAEYVKNSKKKTIHLTIKREEEEKELTLIRDKVEIPIVSGKVITNENKKIGYIEISVFSSPSYEQFKKELETLEKEHIEALIIDVRNNTGGYLSSVTDIASLFLQKGQIIYQLENDKKLEKIKDKTKEKRTYPVAVLINAASASASEILASCIKESYHGLVVGTNSFGKGTVQKTKKLKDGSMIKFTVQKWLTPEGNWINEKGVTPTDFIELKSSTAMNEEENNTDKQLDKAIELITKKLKS